MKTLSTALLVALLTLSATRALAQPEARLVARTSGQGHFGAAPIQAKLGQTVEVTPQVRRGGRGKLAPLPEGARVRWLRVRPRMQHVNPTDRTQGHHIYSNGVMFGPEHGRWLGYDTIEYETEPLSPGAGAAIDGPTLRLSSVDPTRFGGQGTIWLAAEITLPGGEVLRTPDGASSDAPGLSREVLRVSFRGDDSFVGWLGSYFHVPYVFASTGAQTDSYVGTDCADALVGARRAMGHRGLEYTSVVGIGRLARSISDVLILAPDGRVTDPDGQPREVPWVEVIRPGDLLAMDFTDDPGGQLPRAWDHLAVLVEDSQVEGSTRGRLDGQDLVRHMTTMGLTDEPLAELGPIRFRLWRWRR